MKYIICGTNRPNSNSLKICELLKKMYDDHNDPVEIIELEKIPMSEMTGHHYGKELPPSIKNYINKVDQADGLIMVVPEYNGSMPGVLKYFIDFWSYPKSFEHRPVCFIGLGGMFGGLRAVEHLQQVFGYRNAFIFPDRIFLQNVWKVLSPENQITDPVTLNLLQKQTNEFIKFVSGLKEAGLHSNQIIRK